MGEFYVNIISPVMDAVASSWMLQTFLITLLTFCAVFVSRIIFKKLFKHAEISSNLWDDVFIHALSKPVNNAVLFYGISLATVPYPDQTSELILFIEVLKEFGLIIFLSWFLVRIINGAEKALKSRESNRNKMDETTASAISKLLRISVIVSAGLIILQLLGYSVSGILAFGGIGGIAVGFAAKDLLSNFFGGMMIYLDRPFQVGDWIRSPDKEIEGTVEDIGWRLTRIRTFDKRPLYVPNAVFTQVSVENPSRMTNRRIYETVGVRYEDAKKLPVIIDDVRVMLEQHPEIDQNLVIIVNFDKFAESSLDFFIYTLTKTTHWVKYHSVKQDVLFKVLEIIEQHGAEAAFPTSTVHIDSLPQFSTPEFSSIKEESSS
jgi:MscS family membrane protein